jgi:hypothetical protein
MVESLEVIHSRLADMVNMSSSRSAIVFFSHRTEVQCFHYRDTVCGPAAAVDVVSHIS